MSFGCKSVLLVLALCACGDAGSRDRSVDDPVTARARTAADPADSGVRTQRAPRGLMTDALSPYYSADAALIVRFDEPATLIREAVPQLSEVAGLLPELGIPDLPPIELLRQFLDLPEGIAFDAQFPFALVKVRDGWIGIGKVLNPQEAPQHFRPLDERFHAAGNPELLEAYQPAFEHDYHLPGDMSLILREGAFEIVSDQLRTYAQRIGFQAEGIESWAGLAGGDLARIDLSFRFGQAGLRIDLRLGARVGSSAAGCLESLRTNRSQSGGWLPADGTLYADVAAPFPELALLARQLLGAQRLAAALQVVGAGLGSDTAWMLDVDPDGSASLLCVSEVEADYQGVAPEAIDGLIRAMAGSDGSLTLERSAFERGGIQVSVLRGSVGPSKLESWRQHGWLRAWLAARLESGIEAFGARVENRLCIVGGDRGRAEAERLLDRLRIGRPAATGHEAEVAPLGSERLASFSVDLAALHDGTRHTAADWLENGDRLEKVKLRWRLPASGVLVADHDHLRLSLRLRPRLLAGAAARILAVLSDDEPPK